LDIDGTLATWSGYLSPATVGAVQAARATDGVHLVLATGRSAHSTMGMAERLGIDTGWAVCSNGSLTIRLDPMLPNGWEVTHAVTFDARPALDAITTVLPDALVAVEVVSPGGFLVSHPFPDGELDGDVKVEPMERLASQPVTRVILRETELDPQQVTEIVEATHLPDVTYAIGWTGWIDLNPPGVSKASALEDLRKQLGVPPSGTVAVGDGGNDISMLQWASRGVAMGGSRADVVSAASEETATVDQDGVAKLIRDVLSRRSRSLSSPRP
jgi:hydroxymethylpyrimidine pyrophosphatase-like HAD family hydrolase